MEKIKQMAAAEAPKRESFVKIFACKCPRCRQGDMFEDKNPYHLKSTMKMHKRCPVCDQPFELEVGFFYGSGYVSYALSVAISVGTLALWWFTIGLGLDDNRFLYWIITNAVLLISLQPLLMRLARAIWIAFFVGYDPDWKNSAPVQTDRTNEAMSNAW
ncbi:DUF983 domain-containing protein [Chitinophaga sedimenti]|uniref:DUF983 domain-containing protein n=1 Tax=Chitinophaga sedimenti TaxID=2033606 RepID=UPI00200560D2|nr:DUF983 domain-containing protein [Chitinophaga sedimenti]MCK7555470.1 DUF983 domain-containing protein [Chitinophaga sedimenti]